MFLVIEGALDFVDDAGKTVATENWQTCLERYHDYGAEKGLVLVNMARF